MASKALQNVAGLPAELRSIIHIMFLDEVLEGVLKGSSEWEDCFKDPTKRKATVCLVNFDDREYQKWLSKHYQAQVARIQEYRRLRWGSAIFCAADIEVNGEHSMRDWSDPCHTNPDLTIDQIFALYSDSAEIEPLEQEPNAQAPIAKADVAYLPLSDDKEAKAWVVLVAMTRYASKHKCDDYIKQVRLQKASSKKAVEAAHWSCTAELCELEAQHPLGIQFNCPRRVENDVTPPGVERVYIFTDSDAPSTGPQRLMAMFAEA